MPAVTITQVAASRLAPRLSTGSSRGEPHWRRRGGADAGARDQRVFGGASPLAPGSHVTPARSERDAGSDRDARPTPSAVRHPRATAATTPPPAPSGRAVGRPVAPPTPSRPRAILCAATSLAARITLWGGAMGHRIATVERPMPATATCLLRKDRPPAAPRCPRPSSSRVFPRAARRPSPCSRRRRDDPRAGRQLLRARPATPVTVAFSCPVARAVRVVARRSRMATACRRAWATPGAQARSRCSLVESRPWPRPHPCANSPGPR